VARDALAMAAAFEPFEEYRVRGREAIRRANARVRARGDYGSKRRQNRAAR